MKYTVKSEFLFAAFHQKRIGVKKEKACEDRYNTAAEHHAEAYGFGAGSTV